MIILSAVKAFQGRNVGDNLLRENLRGIELCDVSIRNPLLLIIFIKNRRTVGRTHIWALPIQLRWVVRDGEIHPQKLSVGDTRRVVNDFNRFGMSRGFSGYLVVGGGMADPPA